MRSSKDNPLDANIPYTLADGGSADDEAPPTSSPQQSTVHARYSGDTDTAYVAPAQSGLTGRTGVSRRPVLGRLDPLFYLIVGCAAIGLLGSLYALITQNNAYFDQELEQLRRETAALNVRLAANREIMASATRVDENVITQEIEHSPVDGSVVAAVSNTEAAPVSQPVVVAPAQISAVQSEPVSPDVPVVDSSALESRSQESDSGMVASREVSSLKGELDVLRSELNTQQQQIRELLQQNRQLRETTVADQKVVHAADVDVTVETVVKPSPSPSSSPSSSPSLVQPPSTAVSADSDITRLTNEAYAEYMAGRYDSSARLYDRAVQYDPYNRDASLGVAANAQKLGDYTVAENRYRHLLSLNPTDELAFSALLNLASVTGSRDVLELELMQHSAQYGNPAELTSILGNYFAQHSRWQDAEAAFATALQQDANHADYLYNYAVVLDNLGHSQNAVRYYTMALDASHQRDFSFDPEGTEKRLESLKSGL